MTGRTAPGHVHVEHVDIGNHMGIYVPVKPPPTPAASHFRWNRQEPRGIAHSRTQVSRAPDYI